METEVMEGGGGWTAVEAGSEDTTKKTKTSVSKNIYFCLLFDLLVHHIFG
jgi:hypothetical protein